MNYRALGRTGLRVSEISVGTWALGAGWGEARDEESLAALRRAVELGVNFFDTADKYGEGRSERLLAELKADFPGEQLIIATKIGQLPTPHGAHNYTATNMSRAVENCLKNLGTETLDLVQLHCPPNDVYYSPETFAALDSLAAAGKIRHYGVSVQKVEQALKALDYPNLQTVQIIFNMFRLRPAELFFRAAARRGVGIIARVPLASGLLTGKMSALSRFPENDHRNFNIDGEFIDRGETFSGVDFSAGLAAVEELKELVPPGLTLAQLALRWILMFDEVSCAIPGARRPAQAEDNIRAGAAPPLSGEQMRRVEAIYQRHIKDPVHYRW
jgi:aryl-alcohol dehydrogenase-like predicted oxidoreductase